VQFITQKTCVNSKAGRECEIKGEGRHGGRDVKGGCSRPTAVWLSGNALASINVVALRQTRLVPGWVIVCGQVNHFGM